MLSGAICGLAGALNAIHLSSVAIESLHYETSGLAVMIWLLGGMGTFFGPFIGAALLLLILDAFSVWTEHWQLYMGAVFILFVLFSRKESGARSWTSGRGKKCPLSQRTHRRRHPAPRRIYCDQQGLGRLRARQADLDHRSKRRRKKHLFQYLALPEERRIVPGMTVLDNLRLGIVASDKMAQENAIIEKIAEAFPRLNERLGQVALSHASRTAYRSSSVRSTTAISTMPVIARWCAAQSRCSTVPSSALQSTTN